ncbi:MAG: agmatine deiminase family protein [Terracoccus sp.]
MTGQSNGWGQRAWAHWDKDRLIGHVVADLPGADVIGSALVNEGGGIHVDDQGTVLLTDTVRLDRHRDPTGHDTSPLCPAGLRGRRQRRSVARRVVTRRRPCAATPVR